MDTTHWILSLWSDLFDKSFQQFQFENLNSNLPLKFKELLQPDCWILAKENFSPENLMVNTMGKIPHKIPDRAKWEIEKVVYWTFVNDVNAEGNLWIQWISMDSVERCGWPVVQRNCWRDNYPRNYPENDLKHAWLCIFTEFFPCA